MKNYPVFQLVANSPQPVRGFCWFLIANRPSKGELPLSLITISLQAKALMTDNQLIIYLWKATRYELQEVVILASQNLMERFWTALAGHQALTKEQDILQSAYLLGKNTN